MTREEAIKWVKFVHDVLYEDKDEDIRTALDMAIESLSDDAIPFDVQLKSTREVIDRFARDRVKVVRCKDCRHRDLFSCPLADNNFQKDEDFCSWGERREE